MTYADRQAIAAALYQRMAGTAWRNPIELECLTALLCALFAYYHAQTWAQAGVGAPRRTQR